jgi:hypothetical protein
MLALDALAFLFLARLCQAAFIGVSLVAVGYALAPLHAMAMLAVVLAGSIAGEAIPAQLGATDAALVAAGPSLGVPLAMMAGVAVLFHIVQLAWVALGATAAMSVREPVNKLAPSEAE